MLIATMARPARGQACIPAPPDLVGWWTFDETSGTTAADTATSGTVADTGTLQSGASFVSDTERGRVLSLLEVGPPVVVAS